MVFVNKNPNCFCWQAPFSFLVSSQNEENAYGHSIALYKLVVVYEQI